MPARLRPPHPRTPVAGAPGGARRSGLRGPAPRGRSGRSGPVARLGRPDPGPGARADAAAGPGTADELYGIDAERAALRAPEGRRAARRTLLRRLAPGSPLLPVAVRTLAGCALAGYLCAALGVGRPYWAIVTAASLYQANITLSWNRTLQRTLGNLLGVLVFAAVLPVSRISPLALVCCCLFFSFAAEALITRNYWLGSVAVTPMALLVLEFGGAHPAGELIGDRVLDTVLGAVAGFLAATLVTNRRAAGRVERALDATGRARADAERTGADPGAAPEARDRARRTLTASLVELREAGDAAAGEWWQRALPEQRLLAAEQAGHRTLAATAQRRGPGGATPPAVHAPSIGAE